MAFASAKPLDREEICGFFNEKIIVSTLTMARGLLIVQH